MIYLLVILHILVAIGLVISILLQSGRGGGLAGALGGSFGGGAVFGGRGAAGFLTKVTTGFSIAFVVLTLLINIISTRQGSRPTSVIPREASSEIPTTVPGGEGLPETPPTGGGMPQTPPPTGD
ncbi:preprotein translocase subunit SecG [bacterium]|nr:MAG: preprotein translocase subunit SecG [bacterium]